MEPAIPVQSATIRVEQPVEIVLLGKDLENKNKLKKY